MAFSLSRSISAKLLKPSLSPCPFSSLSASHSVSQILNPSSSTSFSSSPSFPEQNPKNPSSNPSFIFSADSTALNRFSAPFGVESINPSIKFLRSFSLSPTQILAQRKPIDPDLNSFKPSSDFPQTAFEGKPKSHFPGLIKPCCGYTVFSREKTTNPNLPFFRSFASSDNLSSEAKADDPERKPISSSSTISDSSDSSDFESGSPHSEFQHQEIVGPTVERDVSALAEEKRQVLQNLKKTINNLSRVVALLGLVQLSCGAWIAYTAKASPLSVVSIQSFMAFGFPFSLAFLLRQMLKPMNFLQKMEEQGRLQILTLALQVSKCMNLFFLRVKVVSFFCVVGMLMGLLYSTWSGFN